MITVDAQQATGIGGIALAIAYAWLQVKAVVVVAYLDKYFDKTTPNEVLADEAVAIFKEHILGPLTPEHLIRAAVARACRWRKGVRKGKK